VTTFMLIAGGHHNDWCWTRLVPELEQRGDRAVAALLPTADAAAGFESYARAAVEGALAPHANRILASCSSGIPWPAPTCRSPPVWWPVRAWCSSAP
jgi:hypothetical protein